MLYSMQELIVNLLLKEFVKPLKVFNIIRKYEKLNIHLIPG